MTMTKEALESFSVQLRPILEHSPDIPEGVKASGLAFLSEIDKWSESMKEKEDAK